MDDSLKKENYLNNAIKRRFNKKSAGTMAKSNKKKGYAGLRTLGKGN